MERRQTLCQNGVLSLSCTLSIYNSCIEGRLCGRMESPPFPVHFLYTTHIEKADSVAEWSPLPFLYTCYIQLIQKRPTLWQNGVLSLSCTLSIYNSYRKGRLSVRIES